MEENSVTRRIVSTVAGLVAILVLIFNAVTTFTYGSEVIGAFILPGLLGPESSALLSGLLTVLLFDAGWLSGLFVFIHAADTLAQRATAALQFALNFLFSVAASVVSILLLSPIAEQMTESSLLAARYVGVAALLIALTLNAAAWAVAILTAPEVAEKIQEATRKAQEIDFRTGMIKRLDKQSIANAKAQIEAQIPHLSQLRADAMLHSYVTGLGYRPEWLDLNQPLLLAAPGDPAPAGGQQQQARPRGLLRRLLGRPTRAPAPTRTPAASAPAPATAPAASVITPATIRPTNAPATSTVSAEARGRYRLQHRRRPRRPVAAAAAQQPAAERTAAERTAARSSTQRQPARAWTLARLLAWWGVTEEDARLDLAQFDPERIFEALERHGALLGYPLPDGLSRAALTTLLAPVLAADATAGEAATLSPSLNGRPAANGPARP